MYRIFVLIILGLVLTGQAQAQRYLPGQKGFQVTASAVDGFNLKNGDKQAFAVGVAFSNYRNFGDHWVFGAEYLQKKHSYKDILIPTAQFTAEGGYYLNYFASPRKTFLFSIGLSAMAGYETVNWGKELLYDGSTIQSKDAILYGGALSLEVETFLTDRVILLIHGRERLLFGSSINKIHLQIGAGIKFIIND